MPHTRLAPRPRTCVFLLVLASAGFSQQVATRWSVSTSTIGLGLGAISADAGDVDGDGTADVIVGNPQFGAIVAGFPTLNGQATVYSGQTGAVLRQWTGAPGQRLGTAVDGVGDVNGDGFDDVIVGGKGRAPAGATFAEVTVFSGFDGTPIHSLPSPTPPPTTTFFGTAVAGVGDVNGDGVPDFAVGDSQDGSVGVQAAGAAYVYCGASGALLFGFFPPPAAGLQFGIDVAGAGDVNGDGFADVLVGSQPVGIVFLPPTATGRARVYSGFDGSLLHDFVAASAGQSHGQAVAGVGDFDLDGFDDVAFTVQSGDVRVHSGFDGSLLLSIATGSPGLVLDGGGDVDGDGVNDFAVDNLLLSGTGALPPLQTNTSFVGRIRLVGDVDGDGFSEFVTSTTNLPSGVSSLTLKSFGGALPYGVSTSPTQSLSLGFQPGAGILPPAAGAVTASGAAPLSAGVLAVSVASGVSSVLGVTVFVNATPGSYVLFNLAYDGAGAFSTPLNLRQPVIAGLSFYLQCFELNPAAPQGVFASNGLALLFVP